MYIKDLIETLKKERKGIYSICSSDRQVLWAALKQAVQYQSPLLIEATCNQVNQFGGYTGMGPADFRDFVFKMAQQAGASPEQLILGGDHLGTQPFKHLPSSKAMEQAQKMVRLYAEAGFTKLHLDTSIRCADDGKLSAEAFEERACERAVDLAQTIESSMDCRNISYVVGTEVPTPGGALEEEKLRPTGAVEAEATLDRLQKAFHRRGLEKGWERTCALVVQPGVEFGSQKVEDYNPGFSAALGRVMDQRPLVFEAHSTDYQGSKALKALVQEGFSILKVGPALTYTKRQALFALARIEAELLPPEESSQLLETIETIMTASPEHWESHYNGNLQQQILNRYYSYSDRIRYYWSEPRIDQSVALLMQNLRKNPIPATLIYEFFPTAYWSLREGLILGDPAELVCHSIQGEIQRYRQACGL